MFGPAPLYVVVAMLRVAMLRVARANEKSIDRLVTNGRLGGVVYTPTEVIASRKLPRCPRLPICC